VDPSPEVLATEAGKLKKLCVEAGRDYNRIEIVMFAPVVEDKPRRVREQYQEAGAHQFIFILDSPAPDTWERQLSDLATAWLCSQESMVTVWVQLKSPVLSFVRSPRTIFRTTPRIPVRPYRATSPTFAEA
jgi:hypothetical protein